MKKTFWLTLGAMFATAVFAQQPTNPPAAVPAPPSATPTATPEPKPTPKKKAKPAPKKTTVGEELRSTPLVAGPATVIASNVNVRGRSGLIGEVLTKINKGDAVTVIEEITLRNSKEDEPS